MLQTIATVVYHSNMKTCVSPNVLQVVAIVTHNYLLVNNLTDYITRTQIIHSKIIHIFFMACLIKIWHHRTNNCKRKYIVRVL